MSALFLLLIPPIALAAYRVLGTRGAPRSVAFAGAAIAAVVLAVVPAYALRTKESKGRPTETPVSPIFAETSGRVELLVDYGEGWSEPFDRGGETVRVLTGRGTLTVGPLQATRPRATLRLDAFASTATRLVVRFEQNTLAATRVGPNRREVRLPIAAGPGPAVLEVEAASAVTVPVASVHAVADRP